MERASAGAAVCVVVEGRTVVDLWGGWADGHRTRPWTADTLVNVFTRSRRSRSSGPAARTSSCTARRASPSASS